MPGPTASAPVPWSMIQAARAPMSTIDCARLRVTLGRSPRPLFTSMMTRSEPRSSTRSTSAPAAVRQKNACVWGWVNFSRRTGSSITNVSKLAPATGCDATSSAEGRSRIWWRRPVSRRYTFGAFTSRLHVAMVGCQAPDEERLLEHVEVALDGVVRDAEGLAERRRVKQPPLCVRQHGEEATEQEGIGPDAELREVALDVRPEVPLPPVAEGAAERTGKPAAQPERRPGAPRRSRASLRGRERVEIEHADPPRA